MEEEQRIQQRETDILSLVSPSISTDARWFKYPIRPSLLSLLHRQKGAQQENSWCTYTYTVLPEEKEQFTAVVSEWVTRRDGRPNESKNIQKLKHVIAGANEWV
jgi:hypothetical protein